MRARGAEAAAAEIDAEFERLDVDRSGTLSLREFCAFYCAAEQKLEEEHEAEGAARARFAELAQGQAYIDKGKFWDALMGLGLFQGLTVEQAVDKVNEQFPLADVDGRCDPFYYSVRADACADARARGRSLARRVPRGRRARSGCLDEVEFCRYMRLMTKLQSVRRQASGQLSGLSPSKAPSFGHDKAPSSLMHH